MKNQFTSPIVPAFHNRTQPGLVQMLWLLVGVVGFSNYVFGAEMTAAEIIQKSEAAYAAVKSYAGSTTVRNKSEAGEAKMERVSTAKVSFVRPGKVHIQGRTASSNTRGTDGHPFTIVSDGKTTWKSWALADKGAFAEVKNLQMAGMAGVAQGAAEATAALLMKSDGAWTGGSDPFIAPKLAGAKFEGREKIEKAECFKVSSKHARLGDVTLWIDSKTYLLCQMTRELNEQQLAENAKSAEAAMKRMGKESPVRKVPIKSMVTVFSFKHDQIDAPVDEKLFADPTKK